MPLCEGLQAKPVFIDQLMQRQNGGQGDEKLIFMAGDKVKFSGLCAFP